jgi:hypothetical protein
MGRTSPEPSPKVASVRSFCWEVRRDPKKKKTSGNTYAVGELIEELRVGAHDGKLGLKLERVVRVDGLVVLGQTVDPGIGLLALL